MTEIRPNSGDPYRAFVCQTINEFGLPAKDRSGRLEAVEKPHLGELMKKISKPASARTEQLSYTTPTKNEINNEKEKDNG